MTHHINVISLSELTAGVSASLVSLEGGRSFVERVMSMGLHPGCRVTVLKNRWGPVLVATGASRIALGRQMAQKIMVAPESECDCR